MLHMSQHWCSAAFCGTGVWLRALFSFAIVHSDQEMFVQVNCVFTFQINDMQFEFGIFCLDSTCFQLASQINSKPMPLNAFAPIQIVLVTILLRALVGNCMMMQKRSNLSLLFFKHAHLHRLFGPCISSDYHVLNKDDLRMKKTFPLFNLSLVLLSVQPLPALLSWMWRFHSRCVLVVSPSTKVKRM